MNFIARWVRKLQPRYCSACGSELVASAAITGYSEQTGIETVWRFLMCPKARPGSTPTEWEGRYAQCNGKYAK